MKRLIIFILLFFLQAPLVHAQEEDKLTHTYVKYDNLQDALNNRDSAKYLDLSKTKLTQIPEQVFQLANLEVLIVNKNKLTSIPNEISKLQHLRELHAVNNKIKVIPSTINALTQLKVLNLNQ
ncbi:MAG: leucine-rich repeat domain-containing protein [Bacteroidetes bacterium]|nr:leucine-rich repeat domain-containing protein [Bacteroidota bacterium]